jgi:uncharacterized membrane-anchored protein
MNKKHLYTGLFAIMVIAQIYVPASMIIQKESTLTSGIPYKFKTAPIDPNDPFRGKYITLGFDADRFHVRDDETWQMGETVYVNLDTDSLGYAMIRSISRHDLDDKSDYIKARAGYLTGHGNDILLIEYPMERFYMEESKAYEAEMAYRESQIDTNQVAYAIVRVKAGDAVVEDVLIDGVSVRELVARETKY